MTNSPGLRYTLRQVAVRDEVVFKSMVGVLQGKTRHRWQHAASGQVDLVVLGAWPGVPASEAHLHAPSVLQLGATTDAQQHRLGLPLRIADVISALDTAGDEIVRRQQGRGSPAQAETARGPVSPTRPLTPLTASAPAMQTRVSLLRWPDPALLQRDVRHIKLATVLTGPPVSIAELAERARLPLDVCQSFVLALQGSGLLRVAAPAPPAGNTPHVSGTSAAAAAPHGLLARIRARLESLVGGAAPR